MGFAAELIVNVARMALVAAVAVGGILLGKKLRASHDRKEKAASAKDEQQ